MKRFFTFRFLLLVTVLALGSKVSFAQSIFANPITGANPSTSNPYITGQTLDPNIMVSGIGRGSGIAAFPGGNTYNANGWNSLALDANDYFEFIITPKSGAKINFVSFVYSASNGPQGPTQFAFKSSVDGFTATIGAFTAPATNATISLAAAAYQGITAAITFRVYAWNANLATSAFSIDDFIFNGMVSPVTAKYYRSKQSGDWTFLSTWESSADNITWANATLIPTASDKTINIRATHTVAVSTSISLDETIINGGGTLGVSTGGVLNIANGSTGDDIIINSNGALQVSSINSYSITILPASGATINVATGGKIQIGNGVVAVGSGYEGLATSLSNIWNNGSTFEWNSTTAFGFSGGITYFPNVNATTIPNFLITKITTAVISGATATVNGLLVVNSDLIINTTSGGKTFRDGISGSAQLTLNSPPGGGSYRIISLSAIIGGTITINLNKDLSLINGVTIPLGASVNIIGSPPNNITKGANSVFLVNGTVDMHSTNILNTSGSVTVNGTLKTSHPNGLYGSPSTVNNGSLILNTGSTIEYNAMGNQLVQGTALPSPYYNVTFSGSGIKTLVSNSSPLSTVYITGNAIVNTNGNNLGDNGVMPFTNFTMDGGRLILTTVTAAQPYMTGVYNLTGGVVEFASSQLTTQTIRTKSYQNIEVTGNNVGNSNGNITLNTNGTFTVKTGGIFQINDNSIKGAGGTQSVTIESGGQFKTGNNRGFHGFAAALINNSSIDSSITNINLNPGSIVEYSRAGDQPITNANGLIYQNLVISGSGNKTAPAGILTVQGQLSKTGTSIFLHNGGTVLLNGTGTQNFAGLTYNNLILSNSTKITSLNSTIVDSIKINSGATLSISATDTITLHSDGVRTARMGQLNGGVINYNSTGKFLVERYISSRKAWRFLSVATNSAESIKNQWQEGAASVGINPKPNYGTQITSNIAAWAANGFDSYSLNGPSMKWYDPNTDLYVGIPSTFSSFNTSLGGYMTFVRGDRSATVFGSPVTSAILRSTGALFTGNQPNIDAKTGKFIPVNNPYASAIDLRNISKSYNLFYYVWDPNRGGGYGLGAFQTLLWNGTDYELLLPNSGSYGTTNNFIESGQAFFVGTLGADTSMQLTENAKSMATFAITPFTPVGNPGQELRTNLYAVNPDGSTSLADGVLNNFSDTYNNAIDGMDARKLSNFGENLAIKSNNQSLVVERRQAMHSNDTLFYNLSRLRAQPYRLEFIADQLDKAGLDAYLEDGYLKARTLINLNGTTQADFIVDNNAGSAAGDRFHIVFEAAAGPLPITFTNVKAYPKNEAIAVEWNVENETGIKQYEVEKSGDGSIFKFAASVAAKNGPVNNYSWIDEQPATGNNYYRIKSIDANGKIQYSKIVKVFVAERKQEITIYPNPVKNGIIHLYLVNQQAGVYSIRLMNKPGQLIVMKEINHSTNTGTEKVDINANAPHGIYNLEIIKPDKTKVIKKIVY